MTGSAKQSMRQQGSKSGEDCFASLAMTARYDSAFSRRCAPELCQILRLENQRAQGKPGARCTRSLAWCVKNTRVSHHRFTGTPSLPCAMVLTAYFALSPVTGLSCHRRPQEACKKLARSLLLKNLTPASGRQDHTTSPSADKAPSSTRLLRPPHPY